MRVCITGAFFVLTGLVNVSYAEEIVFPDIAAEAMKRYFSPVHYAFGGNDFGGGFLWLPAQDTRETITDGTKTIVCRKKLRGYYYNAVRGNRLRPLDEDTLSSLGYADLQMTGGIYTNCEGNAYGRYGLIEYTHGGTKTYLIVGVKVDLPNNTYVGVLRPSFENFNNQTPLGYIFDSVGGIGFVGGKLSPSCHQYIADQVNGGININDLFDVRGDTIVIKGKETECMVDTNGTGGLGGGMDAMMSMLVRGNVSLSKALDVHDRQSIKGNFGDKSLLQNTNITVANVVQKARTKAATLCRGKRDTLATTEKVVCMGTPSEKVVINLSNPSLYNGKTIIVKNQDVVLEGSMPAHAYMDLFVDGGKVLIKNLSGLPTQNFDANGYPQATPTPIKGVLLRGNFIINGLLVGTTDGTSPDVYKHRLFLHGKLISLNTPMVPQNQRLHHISTLTSVNQTNLISFQDIFKWTCNPANGIASDGVSCGGSYDKNLNPLYVIDHDFKSNLF